MAEVQHAQIKSKLLEEVAPTVDQSDLVAHKNKDLESHVLSRSIAAVALHIVSDLDISAASANIVDGSNDNGIDAIYYDTVNRTLFLIQSKWSNAHSSSVSLAEVQKFLSGVQDLVSEKKDRFGPKIQAKWSTIEDAVRKLENARLVLAYSGSGKLAPDIEGRVTDFLKNQNDTADLFFFETISQKELFSYFVQKATPSKINLTINLKQYGNVESPIHAVYGQVSAADVAKWYKLYGNYLFSGNIRSFLGLKSEVNSGISKTLQEAPNNFWYFNNGITLLVQKLRRQAVGGSDKSLGVFECSNVTIVNGAQTVGTIGRDLQDENSSAFLHARIIELDDPSSPLGQQITRASNTQNRIDARNFVALDPEQERIRIELLVSEVSYEYREGEPLDSSTDGFDFIEGIIALVCSGTDVSHVATAKGYVGGLYADISSAPYKALFNSGTNSARLWSVVELSRRIDQSVKNSYDRTSAMQKGIVVHGNRFLSHAIFTELAKRFDLSKSKLIPDPDVAKASNDMLCRIETILKADYPDSYLAPLFKNVGKCSSIKARL
jgi:hypothetical protein